MCAVYGVFWLQRYGNYTKNANDTMEKSTNPHSLTFISNLATLSCVEEIFLFEVKFYVYGR